MSYDRYARFRVSGKISVPPQVKIIKKATDYYEPYIRGTSRLDLISYDYYGSPDYDWLILMANPSAGNLEFEIPDGTILRIPYPLSVTLELYDREIERHNALYGINS